MKIKPEKRATFHITHYFSNPVYIRVFLREICVL